MNNNNIKLSRFTLIVLLSGLATWTTAQVKTNSISIVTTKNTTDQNVTLEGGTGIGVATSFVIEDEIMQSNGENGGDENNENGKLRNTSSVNTSTKNIGFITNSLHVLVNEIKIYPIPANTFMNIDLGRVKVKGLNIINSLGQKVYTQTVEQQFIRLDLSDFQAGMYFVQMTTSDNQLVTKSIMIK